MSLNPTSTRITVIRAPQVPSTEDQEAMERILAAEPNLRDVIRASNNIVHLEREFFKALYKDYNLAEGHGYEWAYYAPTSRIFSGFSSTLFFKDSSHITVHPQQVFRPVSEVEIDDESSRIPDFSGLQVYDDGSTEWLWWWCENKSKEVAGVLFNLIAQWNPNQDLMESQIRAIEPLIHQLNTQAIYAFMNYTTPPISNSSHPGFFAFLLAGPYFTLFHYEKPQNWSALVEEARKQNKIKSISLWPKVKLLHESVLNPLDTSERGFTHQMLYAFEQLRVSIGPTYVQPSFFQPLVDIDTSSVDFRSTKPMENLINLMIEKKNDPPSVEQVDAILDKYPTLRTPPSASTESYRPTDSEWTGESAESRSAQSPHGEPTRARTISASSSSDRDVFTTNSLRDRGHTSTRPRTFTRAKVRQGKKSSRSTGADPESPTARFGHNTDQALGWTIGEDGNQVLTSLPSVGGALTDGINDLSLTKYESEEPFE